MMGNSKVLFSGILEVSYSQFYIETEDPELAESVSNQFSGQVNGLCGAGIPNRLFFTARPKDAVINLEVSLFDSEPSIDAKYDEVVEVSFTRGTEPVFLCQWAHEEIFPLDLPPGDYRVRYCVVGFEKEYDYEVDDEEYYSRPVLGQSYMIQIWPKPHENDSILKQTTPEAAYWHESHGAKKSV